MGLLHFDYSFSGINFVLILPEVFLFFFIIILEILYINLRIKGKSTNSNNNLIFEYGQVFLNIILLILIIEVFILFGTFKMLWVFNNFGCNFNILIQLFKLFLLLTLIIVIYFINSIKYLKSFNFLSLLLLMWILLASFLVLNVSYYYDLYLTLSFFSFILYIALVGYKNFNNFTIECALKYFLGGNLSSNFILMGITLVYFACGINSISEMLMLYTNLDEYFIYFEVNQIILIKLLLIFSIILILFGLLFKISIFPFYTWILDIIQSGSFFILLMFVIFSKLVFIIIFLEYFVISSYILMSLGLVIWVIIIKYIFLILAFVSFCVSNLSGVVQNNLFRILGFSSISHNSFLCILLLLNEVISLEVFFFYFIIYLIIMLGLIFNLLEFYSLNNYLLIEKVSNFNKLNTSNNLLNFFIASNLLSLAGLPPFFGFYIKFYAYYNLFLNISFFVVVFIALINSIGLIYYLKLIKFFNFELLLNNIIYKYKPINTYKVAYLLSFLNFFNFSGFYFFNYIKYFIFEIFLYV
jgi:NADH-quinone oxidoreductase subunit N